MDSQQANIQTQLKRLRQLIIIVVTGAVVVFGGVLLFLPIDERVLAAGRVRAESDTYLYAPEDGVLAAVHVHEGEHVREGQPIISLDTTLHEARLKQIEAEIAKAESDLALRKARMDTLVKLPLPPQFWHMQEELAITRERLRQAEVERERYSNLHRRGLVSAQEYERMRLSVELAKSEEAKAREKLGILEEGLEDTIVREAVAEVLTAEAEIHRLKVEREITRLHLERCTIRSPAEGVVTMILKRRPGESVARGEDLAHVAHGPPLKVDLFAGEVNYHRIRPGQRVLMRGQAFDTLRHGYIEGTVLHVALEPEIRETDAAGNPVSAYRVVTAIDRTPQDLVIGATLEGRIILRRVALWRLFLPHTTPEPDTPPASGPGEGIAGSQDGH